MNKTLCKTCIHNCTDNKKNICSIKNGIWCNAEYGKKIIKKVNKCKNYQIKNNK